jgi:hypothetical protein
VRPICLAIVPRARANAAEKNQEAENGIAAHEDGVKDTEPNGIIEGNVDGPAGDDGSQSLQQGMGQFNGPAQMLPNPMGFGMTPGMMPNMGWTGPQDFNAMGQLMPNAMNFQNPMGMWLLSNIDLMRHTLISFYVQECLGWVWT